MVGAKGLRQVKPMGAPTGIILTLKPRGLGKLGCSIDRGVWVVPLGGVPGVILGRVLAIGRGRSLGEEVIGH